ncbi:hypothetical protein MKW92_013392 [Papaver armeniacum]|nr:hypothetical protein MKW92_013392 [Papaver armeniacum]
MAAKSSIKTTLSFFLVPCLPVILSFTLSCFADPDELQDFCVADLNATKITMNGFPCKPLSEVTNDDFFYSGLVNEANTDNPFGVGIRPGDVTSFPALNTLELTIDVLDLAPGANVPVHTHPRGSEANLVIKGKVLFGFITTNNVLYSKVLNAGELSVIPKGLVHFVQNVGPEKAVVVAVFNSQSPGASVIPFNLFGSKPAIPNDILAKNFLVDDKVIASIKSKKKTMATKFSIKTTSSFFLVLCLTVLTLSCFADPDELQDFCVADLNSTTIVMNGFPCKPISQVTTEDFFYSGLVNEASTANPFGLGVRPGDVTSFPGLNTLGLSINILDLAPGGIVPLHTHPRATEANLVIKGKVFFGFLTTNNVLHSKVITAGEVSIIPEGLVHFVQNVGKSKAVVVAMFNSQSPGAAGLPFNLFGSTPAIPNDLLAKNFLVDEKVIANIKSKFAMAAASSFFLVLCLTVFTLSCFADPDELQDFCVADLNSSTIVMNGFPCKPMSQVTTEDFFYSGLVNEASTANPFGLGVRPGDVTSFPGLNTLGLSINILDLAPGGIVPLHTHPRATEANLVIKGKVFFGVIKAGEVSIIPKGLVHFVQNVGKSKAVVVAMFNSQSPGAAGLPFNLFGSTPAIPDDLLAKNFLLCQMLEVLCLTVFTLSCFADPDELQDFCVADLNSTTIVMNGFPCKPMSQVTTEDFFYSGLVNEASTANPFGLGVRPGDVTSFPGLNTLGLSINILDLAPGGIVPLHTHPRATEANLVIKGKVFFGFLTTNNVLHSKVIKAGEVSIIPKGLVHFVQNVGKSKAVVVAMFNSQSPGAAGLPFNLFGSTPAIPNDLLAKNFLVDEKVIANIKSKFGN